MPDFALASVESVDSKARSVRLRLEPEAPLTGWIPYDPLFVAVGGGFGMVLPLMTGDQVVVLHEQADHPRIVGRLFSMPA